MNGNFAASSAETRGAEVVNFPSADEWSEYLDEDFDWQ